MCFPKQQTWWAEILSSYDFMIKHLSVKNNPAEWSSRRPDYEIGYQNTTPRHLAAIAVTAIAASYTDLLPDTKAAQETIFLRSQVRPTLVNVSITFDCQSRSIDGDPISDPRIFAPTALSSDVAIRSYDNPGPLHCRALQTVEVVP